MHVRLRSRQTRKKSRNSLNRWHDCRRWFELGACPFEQYEGEMPPEEEIEPPVEVDLPDVQPQWPWWWIIFRELIDNPLPVPIPGKQDPPDVEIFKPPPGVVPEPREPPGILVPFPIPGRPQPEEMPEPVAAFEFGPEVEPPFRWPIQPPVGDTPTWYLDIDTDPENYGFPKIPPEGIQLPPLALPERTKLGERLRQPSLQLATSFSDLAIYEELLTWGFKQLGTRLNESEMREATRLSKISKQDNRSFRYEDYLANGVGYFIAGAAALTAGAVFQQVARGGGVGFMQNWTEIINAMSGRRGILQPKVDDNPFETEIESDQPDPQAIEDGLI